MNPDQQMVVWAAIAAIATAVGAGAAVFAARVAVITLNSLKDDSRDRTRPLVGAELVIHPLTETQIDFVVSNAGPTPATKLNVTFSPKGLLLEGDPRVAQLAPFIVKRYSQTIPMLMPGSRLSNSYFLLDAATKQNAEPLPDDFSVTVEYSDVDGTSHYSNTFNLSTRTVRGETYVRPGSKDMDKRLAQAAEAIARGIGRA